MRRLILMRHAKSSWTSGAADDHSRPLNHRGKRDAPRVALELSRLGWEPEAVLSSDARRTRDTWARMSPRFDDVPVTFTRRLYLAPVRQILDELSVVPGHVDTLLLLGHNPSWEAVACELTDRDIRMKTATAALLHGEFRDWRDAAAASGLWSVERVLQPRKLHAADD